VSGVLPSGVVAPDRLVVGSLVGDLADRDRNDAALLMTQSITKAELAELYRSHWGPLVGTATWLLGDRPLAEEVVQDSFIRLVEHWHRINDPGAAGAWLRRTVVNLSRTRVRRLALGRRKHQLLAGRTATTDVSAESYGEGLRDGPVGQAISGLPRRQRECVVLRFVHDLSVDEIANTLDVSTGSVKTHLHRGLKALGAELGDLAEHTSSALPAHSPEISVETCESPKER